jgi:hypothetical protein
MATKSTPAPQPVVTWDIANLEREVSDGYVYTAHWTVSSTLGEFSAGAYGSVGLERPEGDLIPFDQLSKEQVVGWVKEKLGAEQVAATEAALASQIAEQQAPKKASGLPWA